MHRGVRWSQRISARVMSEVLLTRQWTEASRVKIRRLLMLQPYCKGAQDYAFKISVNAALRERRDEARPLIMAELKQIIAK